jgi:PAS domain S-box-containing protein
MIEKQPTYDELLARVAQLEQQLGALTTSEQNFRQITEESPIATFIIQGGKVVYANPSLAKQAGYSRDEIVGKLAPQDFVHRDDIARLMSTLGQRVAGRIQGEGVEYRGIRKDGSIVHIEAYGQLMEYQGKPAVLGMLIDVSARQRLEDALSGSESRLRMALAAANAGAWEWVLRSNENTWSDEVWKLYGLDRQSSAPSYAVWLQSVHPDDRAATEAAVQNAARCGGELWVEWRVNTTDGSLRWLMSRGRPERDAAGVVVRYQGIVVDITERKQMQETLRQSEEKYRNLFNNAEVGMFRTKVDGTKVLDFNEKYLEIYGLKREEMLGRPAAAYWADPAERAVLVEKLKATGRVTDFECRMLTKSGEVKTCMASLRFYPQQGIIEGSMIDITAWKRAEEERLKLEQQLSQAQRLESLGLLAGGIAHDFNNLMSGIYGPIELALGGSLDQESATNLSLALSSMGRARDLTRQLLTFAKGGAPVRTVGPLFPFVEESARFALSGGRATCTLDVAPDLWPGNFDRNQIGQVIDNIVINAQQAMPGAGAIRISARNTSLRQGEAGTLPAGDYVVVSIEDSGIGIPSETLPRIFDPFFTTKETGRGLGLSTCHSIMRRHDGAITAESTPGKGSTFRLYLPAARTSVRDSGQDKSKPMHRGEGAVLVMDDDKTVRKVLASMLAALGYSVETVGDGGSAVELFDKRCKSGHPFRAVLLDLTVAGGMGGKEAAQTLRTIDSSVPLFVTSGYAEDPVMEDPAAHGFKASLRKPFAMSDLSELFKKHILPRSHGQGSRLA